MNRNHVRVGEGASFLVDEVLVDGVKRERVVEFNIAEGWIEQHYTINGKLALSPDGKHVAVRRIIGNVEVKWKDQ